MDPPTLVIVTEDAPPLRIPFSDDDIVMGRDPGNRVALDDGYLSRRHCAFSFRDSHVLVRDLGSYNGTYVNGQKIHEDCYVLPGDVLKVGRSRVFVDFGDVAAQNNSLKIYSPNLAPKRGVEPVQQERAPELRGPYKRAASQIPPATPSRPNQTLLDSRGPATRAQRQRIAPDDKTPLPPMMIEDSAIVRASSSSGRGRSDRDRMRVIAQITRVLSNANDVHELLDHVLSRILSVIPAERGLVMRLGRNRRGLYPECARSAIPGRDHAEAVRLGISHTIARKVIRERVSILVNDATVDQRFKNASSVQDLQIRSILCAPLWLGEQVFGLVYLDHLMHAYAFSEADRDLLVAAANLAALGIERCSPR